MSQNHEKCPRCTRVLVKIAEVSMIRCNHCGFWKAISLKNNKELPELQGMFELAEEKTRIPLES
ncbi:MAG: hypothetical protein GF308_21045 [Candidatus Heimdallarchaeota archaeon]|nr:hypothetical protein [Candidatus Heimdallarchaeota archaeon]